MFEREALAVDDLQSLPFHLLQRSQGVRFQVQFVIHRGIDSRSLRDMDAVRTPNGVVQVNCIERFLMNEADLQLLKSI